MKTAAVVIDSWKLHIFEKHLVFAGFSYTTHPGPTKNVLTLRVSFEWVKDLQPVLDAANAECEKAKKDR